MKSPIQAIKDGIIAKDLSLVIEGYVALTGDSSILEESSTIPEKTIVKKKTTSKKKKPKIEEEDDENVINANPVPGPKSGLRSGPINAKENNFVILHQKIVDEKEVKNNKALAKKQQQEKGSRPKSKIHIPCPNCKGDVRIFRDAEKYTIDSKDHH